MAGEVQRHFHVFDAVIPRNVRLSEAPCHGKPVMLYDAQSKGAQGYLSLAREVDRGRDAMTTSRAATDEKRRALGRGLDALCCPTAREPAASSTANKSRSSPARIERIVPQKGQPRQHFDDREARRARAVDSGARACSSRWWCAALRATVRAADDRYEIIAGERRWRAAQRAGLRELLVVVKDVSPERRRSSSRSSRTSSART